MDLNWEKARVGLGLAVQRINSSTMSFDNVYDNESPIISVGGGPEDDDSLVVSVRYDFDKSCGGTITDADKHVDNCFPRKETEVKGTMMKRPRLDDSINSENLTSKHKQSDSVTHSEQITKPNKIGEELVVVFPPSSDNGQLETCASTASNVVDSGFAESCTVPKPVEVTTKNMKLASSKNSEDNNAQQENSESYDGAIEPTESDSSTYFSPYEEDGHDTSFEVQVENAPTEEKGYRRSLGEGTPINSSTRKSSTHYFIRLFLDALEDKSQSLDPTITLLWKASKIKEVVDVFVQLAESDSEEAVQQCKTEAVESLQRVYERFLKSSKTFARFKDTEWSEAFSILQTLCDSTNICEEFIKFFACHMITPKTTTNLDDPEEIIEGLAEYETTRFGLLQLHNALRKYSKFVEECDSQSSICSGSSQTDSLDIRRRIESKRNKLDIELLREFNEYSAKISDNFFHLNYMTMRNVMFLKSRTYFGILTRNNKFQH